MSKKIHRPNMSINKRDFVDYKLDKLDKLDKREIRQRPNQQKLIETK